MAHRFARPCFRTSILPPFYTVGIVPPSMTYSLPVMEEARSDARNATSSATSSGRFGLPSGMPPSESMMRCLCGVLADALRCAISLTIPTAACVSVYPGATGFTRIRFRSDLLREPFVVVSQRGLCRRVRHGSFKKRQRSLDGRDVDDHARACFTSMEGKRDPVGRRRTGSCRMHIANRHQITPMRPRRAPRNLLRCGSRRRGRRDDPSSP
jgi:hypothetical protein